MPNLVHTEKHVLQNGKVLKAEIRITDCCETPREWDNLSTLLLYPSKAHWTCEKSFEAKGYESDKIIDLDIARGFSPYKHLHNLIHKQLEMKPSEVVAYPITKYEHGNISLSLGYGSGWDTSIVGFIYATKEKIRAEYGVKRVTKSTLEKVENQFMAELDTLAEWLNGEVYGYTVSLVEYDELGDEVEIDELDRICGYYGYEAVESAMNEAVEHYLTKDKKEG